MSLLQQNSSRNLQNSTMRMTTALYFQKKSTNQFPIFLAKPECSQDSNVQYSHVAVEAGKKGQPETKCQVNQHHQSRPTIYQAI